MWMLSASSLRRWVSVPWRMCGAAVSAGAGAVEIRDIDVTEDGAPFLVMELLTGESLADRMHRVGNLPVSEVLSHTEQVLDVLGAAHEQGIIHRDIKPANLFITTDGRLKV